MFILEIHIFKKSQYIPKIKHWYLFCIYGLLKNLWCLLFSNLLLPVSLHLTKSMPLHILPKHFQWLHWNAVDNITFKSSILYLTNFLRLNIWVVSIFFFYSCVIIFPGSYPKVIFSKTAYFQINKIRPKIFWSHNSQTMT